MLGFVSFSGFDEKIEGGLRQGLDQGCDWLV
jgi:hypothetical protein